MTMCWQHGYLQQHINPDGSQEYSDEMLKLAGVDKEKFQELIANDGVVGTLDPSVAQEMGLLPSTRVIAGRRCPELEWLELDASQAPPSVSTISK